VFRTIADFKRTWQSESESTLKLLRALSDASLAQPVAPEGRTLGRLAWHLTLTLGEMMSRTGLALDGPREDAPVPLKASAIAEAYACAAQSLASQIERAWTDETLRVEGDMYGEKWTRGATLWVLVVHQAHHRGQMTVLMRQAGLVVPGICGPAREEWAAFGMPAPEI
jgi:uncharacterized damage-inducible protein DinB